MAVTHLRPAAELAERVLLPGDPGRALAVAQDLLDGPRMFNHHRGLWGYTGVAADGELLTVQSTGMGGPSAAIVLEELARLGARRAVRIGTCGALDGVVALGDLVVAGAALAGDGTSRALGAGDRVAADPALTAALGGAPALVATTDLFYERDRAREDAWRAAGAVAVEMEAAALLRLGTLLGVAVGCVLVVSNAVHGEALDPDALADAGVAVGRAGARALLAPAEPPAA
jgi:uridine phosphorylase